MNLAKNYALNYNPIDTVENLFSAQSYELDRRDENEVVEDRSKIFEMLALANEELWVGHFSYWTEQNMPVFKHAVILNDNEANVESKIAQVIDIAIKECERMYPIFNVVLTKGMNPRQAMYPMMMETIGQA